MTSREIILDTETTGLDPATHSILEIGCVELVDRRITKRHYHQYINPGRDIEEGALAVHGISMDQLQDKPKFHEIADDLLSFLGDADLVIHNADFDMGFLAAEFERCGRSADWPPPGKVVDTLKVAREKHPNQRNSLDALCKRYEVDNSARDLHGALLDSEILADVYLLLTGGQNDLHLVSAQEESANHLSVADVLAQMGKRPRVIAAENEELLAHEAKLEALGDECVWQKKGEPLGSPS